jgi:spoIIIJ-associated protein
VNKGKEDYHKVTLNAENYREKREQTLQKLAKKLAAKVLNNRKSVTLEAMNANERRIIHAALQEMRGISTTSVGADPNRRVVISYMNENKYARNEQER